MRVMTMSLDTPVIRQAGAIPWRWHHGRIQVMLITNNQGEWLVPKGNIEISETPVQAAVKECYEEAGVMGEVHVRAIGSWLYRKRNGRLHAVDLYPLRVSEVLNYYPERGRRVRAWIDLDKASKHVKDPGLRPLLDSMCHFLAHHGLLAAAG